MAIDWDSPTFGHPGTNVHVAAWAPDRHDTERGEEQ